MTGQELVLILGAYTALVLGAFGMLIKFAVDSRKTGESTNHEVNNKAPNAPTLRELVEDLHVDMRELRREGNTRHGQNVSHIKAVDRRLRVVEDDHKQHMKDVEEREEGR